MCAEKNEYSSPRFPQEARLLCMPDKENLTFLQQSEKPLISAGVLGKIVAYFLV